MFTLPTAKVSEHTPDQYRLLQRSVAKDDSTITHTSSDDIYLAQVAQITFPIWSYLATSELEHGDAPSVTVEGPNVRLTLLNWAATYTLPVLSTVTGVG